MGGACQNRPPGSGSESKRKTLQRGLGAPKWAAEEPEKPGGELLWGRCVARDEDVVGVTCPLGPAGGEDPVQGPVVVQE